MNHQLIYILFKLCNYKKKFKLVIHCLGEQIRPTLGKCAAQLLEAEISECP